MTDNKSSPLSLSLSLHLSLQSFGQTWKRICSPRCGSLSLHMFLSSLHSKQFCIYGGFPESFRTTSVSRESTAPVITSSSATLKRLLGCRLLLNPCPSPMIYSPESSPSTLTGRKSMVFLLYINFFFFFWITLASCSLLFRYVIFLFSTCDLPNALDNDSWSATAYVSNVNVL